MIVEKMQIKNWRSFYGVHDIEFSTDPKSKISVILATNGVGKTNLMNTFLWCLHAETTESFENPHKILNSDHVSECAKSGKKMHSFVSIIVKIGELRFKIKRSLDTNNYKNHKLEIFKLDDFDNEKPDGRNPQIFINSYIPLSMSRYFFFDGEGSVKMLKNDKQGREDLKKSVMTVIGLDPAERAVEKLETFIRKQKIKKNKTIPKSEIVDSYNAKLDEVNKNINKIFNSEDNTGEKVNNEIRLSKVESDLKDIDEQVSKVKTLEAKSKAREALINAKNAAKKTLDVCELADRTSLSNSNVIDYLMKKPASDALKIFNTNKNPRYPGDIHRSVIEKLLKNERCMCGRSLNEKSDKDACTHILKELANATTDESSSIYSNATSVAKKYSELGLDSLDIIWSNQKNMKEANDKFNEAKDALDSDPNAGIKAINENKVLLEQSDLRTERDDIMRRQGTLDGELARLKIEFEDINKKITEIGEQEQYIDPLIKNIELLEAIKKSLTNELKSNQIMARKELQKRVDSDLKNCWNGEIAFTLKDDFSIKIDTHIPDKTLSSGEKSLVAQSFAANLIKYCIERKNSKKTDENSLLLKGSEIPFVIDSPFGHLDTNYTIAASQIVANSNAQIIYMLSNTQAREDVVSEIDQYVGKKYCMVGNRVGEERDDKSKFKNVPLDWGKSKGHNSIQYNSERECSEFKSFK